MNTMQLKLAVVVAVSFSMVGCGDDDDEVIALVPGVDTGTLVQSWTIEGTRDEAKCTQYGADRMRFIVYDEGGSVTATEIAPCRDFQRTLTLRTRRYTGAATFLNVNGDPVSQTLQVAPFTISNESTTPITVDFSALAMRP